MVYVCRYQTDAEREAASSQHVVSRNTPGTLPIVVCYCCLYTVRLTLVTRRVLQVATTASCRLAGVVGSVSASLSVMPETPTGSTSVLSESVNLSAAAPTLAQSPPNIRSVNPSAPATTLVQVPPIVECDTYSCSTYTTFNVDGNLYDSNTGVISVVACDCLNLSMEGVSCSV